jgi:hypothetical protein
VGVVNPKGAAYVLSGKEAHRFARWYWSNVSRAGENTISSTLTAHHLHRQLGPMCRDRGLASGLGDGALLKGVCGVVKWD